MALLEPKVNHTNTSTTGSSEFETIIKTQQSILPEDLLILKESSLLSLEVKTDIIIPKLVHEAIKHLITLSSPINSVKQ